PAGAPAPAAISAEIIDLEERLARWRRVGIVGSALAASLAAFLVLRNVVYDQGEGSSRPSAASTASAGRFVAVLQRDAASPAFLMTVDLGSRTLTVRRVTADRPPGKSYELWLVSPRFPAPRSLGVVGSEEFTVRTALASYDRETIRDATYAISLEPEGGSPTGATTGPILFLGKLLETAPSQSQ
ncbi:MAG: anti-sigma factor, partial [Proteobacteria bacterium]|nr:anti-sigma factor [Pseudomonadota bacterium]